MWAARRNEWRDWAAVAAALIILLQSLSGAFCHVPMTGPDGIRTAESGKRSDSDRVFSCAALSIGTAAAGANTPLDERGSQGPWDCAMCGVIAMAAFAILLVMAVLHLRRRRISIPPGDGTSSALRPALQPLTARGPPKAA